MFFNFEREETNTKITAPYYEVIYLDDYNNKHYGKVKEPDELLYMRDRYDFLQCNYIQ